MTPDEAWKVAYDLVASYFWNLDHDDLDGDVALHTRDIRYVAPAGAVNGHAEYRAFIEARARAGFFSRHIFSNLRIVRARETEIAFTYSITNFLRDVPELGPGERIALAECDDVARRGEDGVWRFAERRFVLHGLFGGDFPRALEVPAGTVIAAR